jgi:hypothetical protein
VFSIWWTVVVYVGNRVADLMDRFMAASKVLGEESVKEAGQPGK